MATGDDLRAVMRRFPVPVAVVSVELEGQAIGITVGSLVSLSLEPPLVGISIGRQQAAHELIRGAGGFAVTLLSGEQEDAARHFARGAPPIVLWEQVRRRPGRFAPLLDDGLGWLECSLWAEYPAGDHTIFVGEVVEAEVGGSGRGLVYRESAYHPA